MNCLIIGPANIIASAVHIGIFNRIYTKSVCIEKKKIITWISIIIVVISTIGFGINEFIARKMDGWYIVHYYYYISFVIIALTSIISKVNKAYEKVEKS